MRESRDLGDIEQSCYWLANRSLAPAPPLEGRREADIVIVGAGFTGLWSSLFLKEQDPKLEILVLEQGVAAYGASGRNAGQLGESIDHSSRLVVRHFDRGEAERMVRVGKQNLEELLRFLDERGIDCDLERTGMMFVALTPVHLEHLRAEAQGARRLGMTHLRLLDGAQVRAEIHCDHYLGALLNPHGCVLNPVKLADGLKRESERQGTRFFERTRVVAVEPSGGGVRVRTDAGEVLARKAVLATNAYTHQLMPRLGRHFLPLYDYILVSEPLTQAQHEAIGWSGRQGAGDMRSFFNYYRLTADNRILWGGSEALYHRGNRVDPDCDHSPRHYAALRQSFRWHFPALRDLEFPYAWGGPICATTRFSPFFGTLQGGRIVYGLGYTGHGVGNTRFGGQILAHLALERRSPLLDLRIVRRKPFPYPPEPLRSLAVRAVTRALQRVDAGGKPGLLLRGLDALGIGFSS
ncbi:MAG: FAD-dependent oxidoreductase [Acidobacteriota bacterium]